MKRYIDIMIGNSSHHAPKPQNYNAISWTHLIDRCTPVYKKYMVIVIDMFTRTECTLNNK